MEIEFDPAKDAANREKHGISLAAAADMDLGRAVIIEDTKKDYGETRYLAYVRLAGSLHVLCYTWRGGILRVIGLRKANDRERKSYDRPT